MAHLHSIIQRTRAFFAGVLLGLAFVTPVFAATLDGQASPRNILLVGSLVLLAISLALKLKGRRHNLNAGAAGSEPPDLRWWLNA